MREVFTLSVARLLRHGMLRPDATGLVRWQEPSGRAIQIHCRVSGDRDVLRLECRIDHESGPLPMAVQVERLLGPDGGPQWWFRCPGWPARPCGRQVGKLFLDPNYGRLACRHCMGIRYEWVEDEDGPEPEGKAPGSG